jgi:transcriptional regulator GlxA family with amidase domain
MAPGPLEAVEEAGLVLYPGCQAATVHGLNDLLQVASDIAVGRGGRPLSVTWWGADASGRIERRPEGHAGTGRGPGILIVPGRLSGPVDAAEAAPLARWLAEQHARGATLAAVCGGTFLLAETGLLSGRPATSHWAFAETFRARFPDVRLDVDRMIVDDGDIITASGMMAWVDLGLRLAERVFGGAIAAEAARFLLADPAGREQRHYSGFLPPLGHGDDAILKVQHWLQATGARAVTVAEMAGQAGLGERTFLRRYRAATGMKPTEYAQRVRIERARDLLQSTRQPIDRIAWMVGYEDGAAFRRLFRRMVGLSPGDYRRRFAVG